MVVIVGSSDGCGNGGGIVLLLWLWALGDIYASVCCSAVVWACT